tara:strand:+ start:1243 stop:1434 length:192 start_codon:yes stop_codon:yes gene_type:complete
MAVKKRASKSALDRIDSHEKLCRIMQKQTFQKIDVLEQRICRLEKMIVGGMFAIFLALLSNHI